MSELAELGRISKAQQFDYGKHTGDAIRASGRKPLGSDSAYQDSAMERESAGRVGRVLLGGMGAGIGGIGGASIADARAKAKKGRNAVSSRRSIARLGAGGALLGGAAGFGLGHAALRAEQRSMKRTSSRENFDREAAAWRRISPVVRPGAGRVGNHFAGQERGGSPGARFRSGSFKYSDQRRQPEGPAQQSSFRFGR